MKIALLHTTTWPEIGGVENVIRDQAECLAREGHEVTLISGKGKQQKDDTLEYRYGFICPPELSPDFPLNIACRAVLDRGQSDQNFSQYRQVLTETLGPVFALMDVIIVHNIFTVPFNLPLTMALHDLAEKHRMVAWTHDLVTPDFDYALSNPTKAPWNLMRTSAPGVHYVAISDLRAKQLAAQLSPPPTKITVVPNMIDPVRLFGLTPELRESLPSLALAERDAVFILPARVMLRKNIEMATEVIKKLCEQHLNPLLFITGDSDPYSQATASYARFLRDSVPENIRPHLVFVRDFFPVNDATLRDLYLLSDCLLFPSRAEGFGLPIIEAGLYRLPVWCQDVPAYQATENQGAYLLTDVNRVAEAYQWLESLPTFRLQRHCRKLCDPVTVYRTHYQPLLLSLTQN